MQERTKRITASNFGTICKMTEKRDIPNLVSSMLYSGKNTELQTKAIQHGKKYESIAVEKFENETGLKTKECGLFVSKQHTYIASSPDRVINPQTIVEIKCPYSARDYTINDVTVPYLKKHESAGTGYTLKTSHSYFYQVQGQLYCAGAKLCKFVVFTLKDICIIDIERDDVFIDGMVQQLSDFYNSHFKEALLEKCLYNNENRYY